MCGPCPVSHTEAEQRDGRQYGPGSVCSVRCAVYLKGLVETCMTLERRLLLVLYLLLLWLITTKTGQAGIFKTVGILNAEKVQRRKFCVVESARRIIRVF